MSPNASGARILVLGLIFLLASLVAVASAAGQGVELAPFGGTFAKPWYVTGPAGDPSRVLVVEGGGTIRLVRDGVTQPIPFLIVPDVYTGCNDCGLFSVALAPDYATSGLLYVMYTLDEPAAGDEYYLRIDEFRRSAGDPDRADASSQRKVLEIPHFETSIHNGGQLQFGPDGLLYISTGDGGPQGDTDGSAQDKDSLLGKILRIDPAGTAPGQYSLPADNPFAGATAGADEIYSYGLRNPWRFSFDRLTGDLTIGDVGYDSYEEVDFMPNGTGRGANFGWNCFEGEHPLTPTPAIGCTPLPSQTPPVLEYAHPATGAAAVTGGYVIRDGALPSLLGRYVYADIYDVFGGELHTAQLIAGGSSGDSGLGVSATNVDSFGEDACAHIYVATFAGNVYRLEPTSGAFPCLPQDPPGGNSPESPLTKPATGAASGKRAAALKKCKRKKSKKARKRCRKKAKRLPV